jgi:hypothetical protein
LIAALGLLLWPADLTPIAPTRSSWRLFRQSVRPGRKLLDSLLGATVQAIYTCPTCNKETERHPTHTCGTQTVLKRGWPWLNNDWVNTACAFAGGLLPRSWRLLVNLIRIVLANQYPGRGEYPQQELSIRIDFKS